MNNSFELGVALLIIVNILALSIKIILKTNNYPVSWFYKHLRDIPNIWKLSNETTDIGKKILFRLLGFLYPVTTVAFLASAILHINSTFNIDPCIYQEHFRGRDWRGIVTEKYIDGRNHNYQTLKITDNEKEEIIQNWVIFKDGNYELIEIGDSIVKMQGLVYVTLYKGNDTIDLIVDYGCNE